MTTEDQQRKGPRVSNDVLEERITNYFQSINESLIAIRRDFRTETERIGQEMGRLADRQLFLDQRTADHATEQATSAMRITHLESMADSFKAAIASANEVHNLKEEIGSLKATVKLLETESRGQEGERRGRATTLTALDRITMLIIAGIPTTLIVAEIL